MKFTKKFTAVLPALFLAFTAFSVYAEESQTDGLMNKDQVDGRVEESKGKVKEAAGVILD
ncbi:MAG: hypothetical protein V9G14_03740 [Cypionkella sp.]